MGFLVYFFYILLVGNNFILKNMKKEYFVDYPPFINRKKERDFLLDYFHNAPKNILFLYGPKSTGKTTLIKKVINELDKNKYDASFFNVREHFIIDFKSFRTMFFPPNLKEKTKKMLNNSTISVPGFSWSPDDEAMIQTDIFATMLKKNGRIERKQYSTNNYY